MPRKLVCYPFRRDKCYVKLLARCSTQRFHWQSSEGNIIVATCWHIWRFTKWHSAGSLRTKNPLWPREYKNCRAIYPHLFESRCTERWVGEEGVRPSALRKGLKVILLLSGAAPRPLFYRLSWLLACPTSSWRDDYVNICSCSSIAQAHGEICSRQQKRGVPA